MGWGSEALLGGLELARKALKSKQTLVMHTAYEMCIRDRAYTVKNSWYGAENLSLIPGEVGASAVQNIGCLLYTSYCSDFTSLIE